MQSKRSMNNSKLNTPGGNTRATTWGLPAWTVSSRGYSKSWTGPAGGRGGKQLLYGLEDSERSACPTTESTPLNNNPALITFLSQEDLVRESVEF
ncbi:hypothetical protein RRG08_020742 [Elysia crispata]|uniref:Uncharacterized protein n=1 Tax=Elysia crispata TaxID=231223 RepID=A0AAE1E4M5_9GAST|nr:hypothetical protein RRG08_020742 [Elysia crispata]